MDAVEGTVHNFQSGHSEDRPPCGRAPIEDGSRYHCRVASWVIVFTREKMSYLPGEKDMIIVHDEIQVEFPDRLERQLSTMRVEGNPHGDSAMSRAVSLPVAIASRLILEKEIDLCGVQLPVLSEIYGPVLTELEEHTFTFQHQHFEL